MSLESRTPSIGRVQGRMTAAATTGPASGPRPGGGGAGRGGGARRGPAPSRGPAPGPGGRPREPALRRPLGDTRRAPLLGAQVIELGPPHATGSHHLDLVDKRGMDRENPFHPHAVGDLSHDEGFAVASALSPNHHAFEDLNALFLALDHLTVDPNRVADLERRSFRFQEAFFNSLHLTHGFLLSKACRPHRRGFAPGFSIGRRTG